MNDTDMDRIWDEAHDDAIHGRMEDRYQDDPESRAFYEYAFRTNYAEHH